MAEVDRVGAASLQSDVQIQVAGEHQHATLTERRDCRIRESQPLKAGVTNYRLAFVKGLLHFVNFESD